MASIHLSQGALLIGAYINLILYTIEIVAVYVYFKSKRSHNDPKIIKWAVTTALFFDTIGTMGTLATCYLLSINFSRRDVLIQPPLWSLSVWLLSYAAVAFIVHTFLNRRLWILSRNVFTCGAIALLTVVTFTFAVLTCSVTIVKGRTLSTRHRDTYVVVTSLATGSLTDVSITVALLWKLQASEIHTRSTGRLVQKLSFIAITTGAITTTVGLVELVAFLARPDTRVSTAIGFLLGRLYSLTMLFTLIYRSRMVESSELEVSILPSESNGNTELANPLSFPASARLRPSLHGYLGSQ